MSNFTISMGKNQQENGVTTRLNIKKVYGSQKQEKTTDSKAEENKLYPYKTTDGVILELSFEAREKLIQAQTMLDNAGAAKEQGEAMEEATEDMAKIMLIFCRIANGDIVPPRDEQKLMEYNMELYQMAKAAAMVAQNDDPEEYDSVDEEEEENRGIEGAKSSGTISATVEIPVASGGEVAAAEAPAEGGTEE